FDLLFSPEVIPVAARYVELPRGCALLSHRRDQNISTPEILISSSYGDRIVRIVQPERPHDGHPGLATFADGRVKIWHQSVTQFQIFAADRLDRRIMKLALIGIRCAACVIRDFVCPEFAGVPTPGQAQMPGSTMRAKERTEGAELEPTHMQFAA